MVADVLSDNSRDQARSINKDKYCKDLTGGSAIFAFGPKHVLNDLARFIFECGGSVR